MCFGKRPDTGNSESLHARNALNSHYIARMPKTASDAYRELYDQQEKPYLYGAPWWLDTTCGDGVWDARVVFKDEQPAAGFAFFPTSIRSLSAVITPPFTQWMPVISSSSQIESLTESLFAQLPKAAITVLALHADQPIQTPGKKYPLHQRYSYVLPYHPEVEVMKVGYSISLRRNIRMTLENYRIESADQVETFLALCKSSYQLQRVSPPPWLDRVIPGVFKNLTARKCGCIWLAYEGSQLIAGVMIGWDAHTVYYLAGGRSEHAQAASAHALLLDHCISIAHEQQKGFDFEGSMHPGIAEFFQSFGAKPTPYWQIKKYTGLGRIWSTLR